MIWGERMDVAALRFEVEDVDVQVERDSSVTTRGESDRWTGTGVGNQDVIMRLLFSV